MADPRCGAIDNLLRILQARCPDAATRTLVAERVARLRQGLDAEGERLLAEAMAAAGATSLEDFVLAQDADAVQACLDQAANPKDEDPCQGTWIPLRLAVPPGLNSLANTLTPPVQIVIAVLQFVKGVLEIISAFLLAIPDPIRALIMAVYRLLKEIIDNFLNTGAYLYVDAPGVTSTLATLDDLGLGPPEPPSWLAGEPILGATGTMDAFDAWAHRFERSFDDPGDSKRPVFSEGSTLEAAFIVATAPDITTLSPLLGLIDKLLDVKPFSDAIERYLMRAKADDPERAELRGHGVAPDWQAWRIRDLASDKDHPLAVLERLPDLLLGLLSQIDNIVELIRDLVDVVADKVDVLLELARMIQAVIDMLRALSTSGLYVLPVVTDEGVPGLKRRFLEAADRPGSELKTPGAHQPRAMVGVCFLGGVGEFGTAALAGLWALLGIEGKMSECFKYIDDPMAYYNDRKKEVLDAADRFYQDTKALAEDAWHGAETGTATERQGLAGLWGNLNDKVREQTESQQDRVVAGLGVTASEADALANGGRNQLIGGIEQLLSEGMALDPMVLANVEATRRARRRGRRSLAMAYGALPAPPKNGGSDGT